ncbi:hypothetical protein [Cytobacillus praedii]|uniref:hypothetical protein n=1 Tax=Cytobacillus praedii TaxID=1742358 RepID=UPI002E21F8E1|nr:hypothetical protein [Cytobacillus praedii]
MDLKTLLDYEGSILEQKSTLHKDIEHTVYRIIDGDPRKIQEVYDVFYSKIGVRNAFLEYKDAKCTVKVSNEADPDQLYIKGIVDGMRTMYTLSLHYMKTRNKSKNENGEETVNE